MPKYVLPLDQLQSISQEVWASSDEAKIEANLSTVLQFCGLINYQFHYDQALWRGVMCESPDGHKNIKRVGHPPPELTRTNRLNEAGSPLLYTSINQFTVLEEIGAKPGDYVHVVAYKFNTNARLRCGTVGEITQVHRWGRAFSSEHLGTELNRIMKEMSFDVGRSYVFTDSFLSSLVRDPNAASVEYVRSRIFAKLFFKKIQGLEAIIYPSVAHDGAMNLAISPAAVVDKLSIAATFVVHVIRKFDYGIYDFKIIRSANGHHVDGTIDWA